MSLVTFRNVPWWQVVICLSFLTPLGGEEKPGAGRQGEERVAAGALFGGGQVLEIEIEIPQAQLEALRQDHRSYVPVTLREGGRTFKNVGLRLKGSAGSYRPIDDEKPGFTLKLNQFNAGQRFHGLRKVLLNNAAQDPTYVSEILGNEIFRSSGIPAARGCHARVSVNGRNRGLYILFESVSKDFLAEHFGSPDGNLYEGPGDVVGGLDTDRAGINLDQRDLEMVAHAANEPNALLRLKRLEEVLDLDRFVLFAALEASLWHWDGYVVGVNNYRIYNDPTTGRLVFLPHGSDQLFQDPAGPLVPDVQGLVARAVLSTQRGQSLYVEKLRWIAREILDEGRLLRRIDQLSGPIQGALSARSEGEASDHRIAVEELKQRISNRITNVREQISGAAALFGAPLDFDPDGTARLSGWKPRVERGTPEVEEVLKRQEESGEGSRRLIVRAVGSDPCVASWRTRVLLAPGRYRFEGLAHLEGVAALPEEAEDAERRASGVSLRVSKHQPPSKSLGTRGAVPLRYEFRVTGEGIQDETPAATDEAEAGAEDPDVGAGAPGALQVELVCELEASAGQVGFDLDSLRLVRR